MNGQDRSHPLVSSCTGINTSTVSSNGGPSGAVSQSWLREMVADPRIAAQAGIINSRQDMQGPLLNTPFDPNNPNSSRTNMSGMSVNPLLHSFYNNINGSSSNPMFPPGSQFSMSERPLPSSTLASAVGSVDQQRLLMTYTSSADTLNTRPMFTQPAYKASPRDLQPSSSKSSTNSELSSNIPAKRLKTVNDEQNSSSSAHAPATVQHSSLAPIPHRPDYFHKGSVIQLSEQKLKRIEDLQTADFELSASISPNLSLDCSTVVKITEDKARGTAFLTFSVGDSTRQKPVSLLTMFILFSIAISGLS